MSKLTMSPGCVDVSAQYRDTVFSLVGVGSGTAASDDTLRRVALHEAAHAVVGRLLDLDCGGASIKPDGRGYEGSAVVAGHHTIHNDFIASGGYRDFLSSVFLKIQVCLAGPEAERIAFGDCDERGDMRMIEELCERYYISAADVERLRPSVHALLTKHWRSVEVVAEALMTRRTLAGSEIDALCAAAVA